MTATIIDGLEFDIPLDHAQIKALARLHRQQLGDAIYHEDQHIGELGISHRAKIAGFTRQLQPEERLAFYKIYNHELRRLAIDDPLHPPHAEEGVNIFLLVVIMAIAAVILYFAFVRHVTG
ncbi:hypothetical protein [Acinetobacter sp. MB5]|uniref:hypothetical protein n=1 Tax=Acinetobacter sp. MB5 TaxID=2069438 RepID=UPI000DD0AE2F|nr:hypothetical protein [Acinetobacter sp. MB5]